MTTYVAGGSRKAPALPDRVHSVPGAPKRPHTAERCALYRIGNQHSVRRGHSCKIRGGPTGRLTVGTSTVASPRARTTQALFRCAAPCSFYPCCCVGTVRRVSSRMSSIFAPLIVLLALAPSWLRFPSVWAASREHGFAVAGLCVWLLWQRRSRLKARSTPVPFALAAVGVASILWWIALEAGIQVVHLLLSPTIALGWIAATAGRTAAVAAAPVALTFLLAVPIWESLVPLLQWMTVIANQLVLGVVDINAQIKDTHIILQSGTLVVADTCSGLNFLLVGTTVAAAYAWLFARSLRTRLLVVGTAVLLSLVANWIRVLVLVLVADATSMKSPLIADHEVFGWSVFVGALMVFFFIAQRLERSDVQAPQAPAAEEDERVPDERPARHFGPTSMALLGPLCAATIAVLPDASVAAPPNVSVVVGPQWQEVRADSAYHPPASFKGAALASRAFSNGESNVRVDRYQYAAERADAELISTENYIAPDTAVVGTRRVGPLDDRFRLVRETAVRDGRRLALVWSWYRIADYETSSPTRGKLFRFLAALQRRSDAEAVLVSAPCNAFDCTAASSALFTFVTGRPVPPAPARPSDSR